MIHTRLRHLSRAAFTLMEMMLVLGIIAILIAISAVSLKGVLGDAEITKAQAGLRTLDIHLTRFKTLTGGLMPTQLEGLINKPAGMQGKPWRKLADEKDLVDPWGTQYVYRNPGKNNATGYDLLSVGPDKKEGTDDDVWFEQ